jgi:phytoene synthase
MTAADPLAESIAYCRRLTRRTADNFGFSFLTLPRERYNAMCALYAFLRLSDDWADDAAVPVAERQARLAAWRREVADALAGRPASHPVLPAVVHLVRTYGVPPQYLFDVLDGVAWDLQPSVIATFDELADYCYHVAGAVGLCCIRIWGFRDPAAEGLAIDCGVAFQLTNILRDIGEDSRAGRCYLPAEDLQRFGVAPDEFRTGRLDERLRGLLRFEAERAWSYYQRAEQLPALLEPCGRPVLRVMLDIYGGLLREMERRQFDVLTTRVRLPRWKKWWLVGRALWRPGA